MAPDETIDPGFYEITATYTPDNGVANAFTVVSSLEIVCSTVKFTAPPNEAVTYYVNGDDVIRDVTDKWSPVPDCGYEYTESFVWDTLESWMT